MGQWPSDMVRPGSQRVKGRAVISRCGKYRYALWRTWDSSLPKVLFIGLNPSSADAQTDDPTLRRCMGFARTWGFGGLIMGNLFAFRSPNPRDLDSEKDPVGPRNSKWLAKLCLDVELVIAAWGGSKRARNVASELNGIDDDLYCLGLTRTKSPKHPLYVRSGTRPVLFRFSQWDK